LTRTHFFLLFIEEPTVVLSVGCLFASNWPPFYDINWR